MATVSVRYIVHDVDAAIGFYCGELGFEEVMHPAPAFAMLSHGDMRLVLSAPGGGPGGGAAMPDGTVPEPGGWNRFSLEVPDIEATVERLRTAGVRFRNDIVTGVGGKQILVEDPSGNPRRAVRADPRRSPARPPSRLRPRTAPLRGGRVHWRPDGTWRSLVAHLLWEQGVASSNLAVPTSLMSTCPRRLVRTRAP